MKTLGTLEEMQAEQVAYLAEVWNWGSAWQEYVKERVKSLEHFYPQIRQDFKQAVNYDQAPRLPIPRP